MLHISQKTSENHGFGPKGRPVKFFTNLFKKKKNCDGDNAVKIEGPLFADMDKVADKSASVARVPSTLSVREILLLPRSSSPVPSTPARARDIDTDMEALRISRHDNPFLKQVLASRESLADSVDESESDDTTLMAQEFGSDLEDPLTLPEVHEHMIRSPPPTSWPRSPNFKLFRFPDNEHGSSQESLNKKSPMQHSILSPRHESRYSSELVSSHDDGNRGSLSAAVSPRLHLPPRPHQRSNSDSRDRSFSLLNPAAPLRSLTDVRRLHTRAEDSQSLVATETAAAHPT